MSISMFVVLCAKKSSSSSIFGQLGLKIAQGTRSSTPLIFLDNMVHCFRGCHESSRNEQYAEFTYEGIDSPTAFIM